MAMEQQLYNCPVENFGSDHDPSGMTLLIVEDDVCFRDLCVSSLEELMDSSFHILEAGTAAEALELLAANVVDCMLVDIGLPDAKGTTLIERMREQNPEWMGPTVIMTSGGSEEVVAEVLRAGAADYIPKQFISPESLRRTLCNAVEKNRLKISVNEQNKQLLEANQQLEKRSSEITRFYHCISHEIKTPLTAARMFISMLYEGLAGEINEDQKEILSQALDSCDDLTRQFNDLVEATRLESGKMQLNKSMENVYRLVRRTVISVTPGAQSKQIELLEECPEELPDIYVDPGRLIQILANLMGNAIKFTDPGGRVSITVRLSERDARSIIFTVSDTGIGISPEDLDNIFDRLYQVGSKGDALMGAGLGLGLSIAKDIVELHKGTIEVTSELGHGTSFTIQLPVIEQQTEQQSN